MHLIFRVFLIFVLLLTSFVLSAQDKHQVRGKIVASDQDVNNVPLALLRFDPSITDGPPMSPIMRVDSSSDGSYVFEGFEVEKGIFYLVGILFQGERKSSKRFNFDETNDVVINFNFESVSNDSSQIIFVKQILIFQYQLENHSLRVTDFLVYHNMSGSTVNLADNPLLYQLPERATNFQEYSLSDRPGIFSAQDGQVSMGVYSDKISGQLVFEYDLPIDSIPMEVTFPLMNGVSDLETLHRPEELNLYPKNTFTPPLPKQIGEFQYVSHTYKISPDTLPLKVTIDKVPLKQESIVVFTAGIVIIMVILTGFFWVRLKKQRAKATESESQNSSI